MEYTAQQEQGIIKISNWVKSPGQKNIFVLAGYSGTGKTSIIRECIDRAGLSINNVAFMTFTGKASLVLNKKDIPALTIHKTIYNVEKFKSDKVIKVQGEEDKIKTEDKILFRLKAREELEGIKLFVIDESSMVSTQLLEDILYFQKPILLIGDPMQLNAIGTQHDLLNSPDVMLTEIHRQALENPIIYLSMLVRNGEYLKAGNYGKEVKIYNGTSNVSEEVFVKADQIICAKNKTRNDINRYVRSLKGFSESELPVIGDKLICRKNNWNILLNNLDIENYLLNPKENDPTLLKWQGIPLINGMIGYSLTDIAVEETPVNEKIFRLAQNGYIHDESIDNWCRLKFRPDFVNLEIEYFDIELNKPYLLEEISEINKYETSKYPREGFFQYGYAITCHSSQGSEFNKVLVINEVLNRADHSRWLYTAITRAQKKLMLIL